MPSLSMYKISAPTDAKEFENLLLDYSANTYCGRATLLGRQGQAQHGIDVVVTRDDYSKVCVQCKNMASRSITKTNVDQWIVESETSPIKMQLFVIAVAGERDAPLQEYVHLKMEERISEGKYPVEIVFWDDIEHFIKLRPDILQIYYPFLFQEHYGERKYATDKYPELIKSESELKDAFLIEFVKYKIEKMIKVDVFMGFSPQLVVMCDFFEFEIQQVLYRAIAIKNVATYNNIQQFMDALSQYNTYLGSIGEYVNESMIRVVNRMIRDEHESYEAHIDMLRNNIVNILSAINK